MGRFFENIRVGPMLSKFQGGSQEDQSQRRPSDDGSSSCSDAATSQASGPLDTGRSKELILPQNLQKEPVLILAL